MLCENCHKRESMVKFTQVIGSEKKTVNLCKGCAEKQGLGNPLGDVSKVFGKIIVAILNEQLISKTAHVSMPVGEQETCCVCGLSWGEFEKTGRLGCPQCYTTYEKNLKTLLRRLHGNNQHIGKSSQKNSKSSKESVAELKKTLKQAVKKEDYEAAAELRDRIRELQRKVETS